MSNVTPGGCLCSTLFLEAVGNLKVLQITCISSPKRHLQLVGEQKELAGEREGLLHAKEVPQGEVVALLQAGVELEVEDQHLGRVDDQLEAGHAQLHPPAGHGV